MRRLGIHAHRIDYPIDPDATGQFQDHRHRDFGTEKEMGPVFYLKTV